MNEIVDATFADELVRQADTCWATVIPLPRWRDLRAPSSCYLALAEPDGAPAGLRCLLTADTCGSRLKTCSVCSQRIAAVALPRADQSGAQPGSR